MKRIRALYKYAATREDQLTFQKDDEFFVLHRKQDWYFATTNASAPFSRSAQVGLVPANYFTVVEDIPDAGEAEQQQRQERQPPRRETTKTGYSSNARPASRSRDRSDRSDRRRGSSPAPQERTPPNSQQSSPGDSARSRQPMRADTQQRRPPPPQISSSQPQQRSPAVQQQQPQMMLVGSVMERCVGGTLALAAEEGEAVTLLSANPVNGTVKARNAKGKTGLVRWEKLEVWDEDSGVLIDSIEECAELLGQGGPATATPLSPEFERTPPTMQRRLEPPARSQSSLTSEFRTLSPSSAEPLPRRPSATANNTGEARVSPRMQPRTDLPSYDSDDRAARRRPDVEESKAYAMSLPRRGAESLPPAEGRARSNSARPADTTLIRTVGRSRTGTSPAPPVRSSSTSQPPSSPALSSSSDSSYRSLGRSGTIGRSGTLGRSPTLSRRGTDTTASPGAVPTLSRTESDSAVPTISRSATLLRGVPSNMLDQTESYTSLNRRKHADAMSYDTATNNQTQGLSSNAALVNPDNYVVTEITLLDGQRTGPAKYSYTLQYTERSNGRPTKITRTCEQFYELAESLNALSSSSSIAELPPQLTVGAEANYKQIMVLSAVQQQRQREFGAFAKQLVQVQGIMGGADLVLNFLGLRAKTAAFGTMAPSAAPRAATLGRTAVTLGRTAAPATLSRQASTRNAPVRTNLDGVSAVRVRADYRS
ncbi:hypothetical protein RI367_000264 [Sorochytrium milnesiophthora]